MCSKHEIEQYFQAVLMPKCSPHFAQQPLGNISFMFVFDANTFSEPRGMFLSMKVLFLKIPLYFMFRAHLQTLIYPYFRSITTIVSLVLSTTVRNIFFSINWIHLFYFSGRHRPCVHPRCIYTDISMIF